MLATLNGLCLVFPTNELKLENILKKVLEIKNKDALKHLNNKMKTVEDAVKL